MILARRSKSFSVPFMLLTKPLSLDLYATSCCSSLRVWRWSALENDPPPVTDRISSALPRVELNYLYCAGVTGFRSLSPAFLIDIVLRDPTTGERVFVFPKKRRNKKVSQIILSTPVSTFPVSQLFTI